MAPELRPAELIDALTTGIVLLDADDAIVYLNASAQGMLATGATAAIGRPLREIVVADDRLTPLLRRARDSGEPMALRECDFQPIGRRDAQMIVDCTLTPLHPPGEMTGYWVNNVRTY